MGQAAARVSQLSRQGLDLLPALGAATLGGVLFTLLGVPLGWMLGAMSACMLITICGVRLQSPTRLRPPMAVLLGLAIGAGFQPQMLAQMALWLPSLLLVLPMLVIVTVSGTLYFSRVAGYDRVTATYCALPGGLTEIALLAESVGADVRTIALVHAARIVITITVLSLGMGFFLEIGTMSRVGEGSPFIPAAGSYLELGILIVLGVLAWRLGKRLGLPAPHMIAPLLLSATIHVAGWTAVELPSALIAAAQVIIGAGIGCRFAGATLRSLLGVFLHGTVFVGVVLGLCVLIALSLTGWVEQPIPTIILAFSPGGLTELSLLALSAGLEAGFVAAHHLIRQISVVTIAPIITKRANKS